jgi:hypothetical protein
MTTRFPSPSVDAAANTLANDAETLLRDWSDAQIGLIGAGLGALFEYQQAMFSTALALLGPAGLTWPALAWDAWRPLHQAGASAAATAGSAAPASTLRDAWWAPWAPFWQRGAEQLA